MLPELSVRLIADCTKQVQIDYTKRLLLWDCKHPSVSSLAALTDKLTGVSVNPNKLIQAEG